MRRFLELIALRVFRTRYGIALALAVVIFGTVGGAKLLAGPGAEAQPSSLAGRPASPGITVDPTDRDDGLSTDDPEPSPIASPGAAEPMRVARAFATAWLHHRGVSAEQWHDALLPHSTQDLAAELSGVDPVGVPADRITGEPTLVPHGDRFIEVAIPVDSGTLRLSLVAPEGRWLVDGVDWAR